MLTDHKEETEGEKEPTMTATTSPTSEKPSIVLCVPEPADFPSLVEMKGLAFAEKGVASSAKGIKHYEDYHANYPTKLRHCRVVKEDGKVVGACQVQLPGDPPDKGLPAFMQHKIMPGEAYIEFIACHPDFTGRGIGSKLMAWAESCAREGGATRLTLEVMKKNAGAVRLYQRKGYVIKRDPRLQDECDAFCGSMLVFCCLGCTYWTIYYMEKPLTTAPVQAETIMER